MTASRRCRPTGVGFSIAKRYVPHTKAVSRLRLPEVQTLQVCTDLQVGRSICRGRLNGRSKVHHPSLACSRRMVDPSQTTRFQAVRMTSQNAAVILQPVCGLLETKAAIRQAAVSQLRLPRSSNGCDVRISSHWFARFTFHLVSTSRHCPPCRRSFSRRVVHIHACKEIYNSRSRRNNGRTICDNTRDSGYTTQARGVVPCLTLPCRGTGGTTSSRKLSGHDLSSSWTVCLTSALRCEYESRVTSQCLS